MLLISFIGGFTKYYQEKYYFFVIMNFGLIKYFF